jgi:glycosyltransferase involved in cell wall biosynthesis
MPVYNEASGLESTVSEIAEKVMNYLPNSMLMIFEDGSEDDSKRVILNLTKKYSWLQPHLGRERKGYSRAVRDAILSVSEQDCEYVMFMDSDGQYDPADFFKLWETMQSGKFDIVMAQRQKRAEPLYRVGLSSGLRVLERVLFDVHCEDVTSAFRLIRTDVAHKVASEITYSKYSFWLEFTARATMEGRSFCEVPVVYRERKEGTSNVYSLRKMPKIAMNELTAVLKTWWEYKVNGTGFDSL